MINLIWVSEVFRKLKKEISLRILTKWRHRFPLGSSVSRFEKIPFKTFNLLWRIKVTPVSCCRSLANKTFGAHIYWYQSVPVSNVWDSESKRGTIKTSDSDQATEISNQTFQKNLEFLVSIVPPNYLYTCRKWVKFKIP